MGKAGQELGRRGLGCPWAGLTVILSGQALGWTGHMLGRTWVGLAMFRANYWIGCPWTRLALAGMAIGWTGYAVGWTGHGLGCL
jgi:hypothetical protein